MVDITLAPKFTDNVCQLTTEQMQEIQNQAILDIWEEWERLLMAAIDFSSRY